MRKLLFACLTASLSSAAVAAETSTPQSPSDQAASPKPQGNAGSADDKVQPTAKKKICKNLDAGFSHRTERVCMTAEQWEEYNRGE